MSYDLAATSDGLALRVVFEKVFVQVHGAAVELLKLPMQLGFARKAANLSELGGGELEDVYVFKCVEMAAVDFDVFARNLCWDADWLVGQSLAVSQIRGRLCLMLTAPSRPALFIDTQGCSYARYVARLG